MTLRRVVAFLVALPILACSSSSEADQSTIARFDTVAGNRVRVANTGRSLWTEQTAWRLEEDLRLGSASASEGDREQFGDIASITSDSHGKIYILDSMAQEVRVFLPNGSFSHVIGRKGSGPGEFEFATSVTIGRGDTLFVLDDGTMRYSVFAPDGTLVETHRRSIVGTNSSIVGAVLSDGSYIDWAPVFPEGRMGPTLHLVPVRHLPRFERTDSLPPLEYTWEMLPNRQMPQTYYSGGIVGAVDAKGRIWFARSEEYRIYRRGLAGDTSLVFSLPAASIPLGEAERATLRKNLSHLPDLLSEILDALPETLPIVRRIVPDNAGHIFVVPDVAGEAEGVVVDVFQERGVYLGRMTVPGTTSHPSTSPRVVHATAEHLFVVTTDEFDVPYLVRFRIRRGH